MHTWVVFVQDEEHNTRFAEANMLALIGTNKTCMLSLEAQESGQVVLRAHQGEADPR